jgi:hypothetical protein
MRAREKRGRDKGEEGVTLAKHGAEEGEEEGVKKSRHKGKEEEKKGGLEKPSASASASSSSSSSSSSASAATKSEGQLDKRHGQKGSVRVLERGYVLYCRELFRLMRSIIISVCLIWRGATYPNQPFCVPFVA